LTDLLIRDCQVLQIAARTPQAVVLHEQDIVIHGNRIQLIQPTNLADPSHFRQVIEAHGMLAMPGLINTHAHVPMVLWRGLAEDVSIDRWFNDYIWQLEGNLKPDDVYWGTLLGQIEMIEGGVTSVADHYFHMNLAAQAVERVGTRALLGWAMFGSQGVEAIEQAAEFVRRWQGVANGRIRTCIAPHAPYTCDDDFLRASAEQAEKLGVGLHIHAAENMEQTRVSLEKRGLTPIQVLEQTGILNLPTIVAHACGAHPDDIEILSQHRVGIAHAPKTYLKLAMDIAPVLDFRRAGIAVGLATDGAVSNNTLDIWESLRLIALMQKDRANSAEVMTIPEALYIATRDSARVFGLDGELGTIEPGCLADIILVDLDGVHHQPLHSVEATLVYNTRASDVQTVIVDGKLIMRDRHLLTIDKLEVTRHAQTNMERLARRQADRRIQTYNL